MKERPVRDAVGRDVLLVVGLDQPVQMAAQDIDRVDALRLADDRALDLQLARARREVDRPHLERAAPVLPGN
jgi:hypothetical protein